MNKPACHYQGLNQDSKEFFKFNSQNLIYKPFKKYPEMGGYCTYELFMKALYPPILDDFCVPKRRFYEMGGY